MPFIDHQQPKVVLGQIAFDEFGRLVAALANRELKRRQRSLHALGLAVTEHQIPVFIHEVDELVDVVLQHGGQRLFSEGFEQALGRCRANGRQLLQRVEYKVVHRIDGATTANQRPHAGATVLAFAPAIREHDLGQLSGHRQCFTIV